MRRVLSKEERFRKSFPLIVFCCCPSFLYSMYSQESCDKLRETHLRRELASLNQTINKLQKTGHLRKEQPKWRPNKYIYHINNLDGAVQAYSYSDAWALLFDNWKKFWNRMRLGNFTYTRVHYIANEGTVRIQYKCLVPIDVSQKWNCVALLLPKQNYYVLSPIFTFMYLWVIIYCIFPGSVCLFCCSQIGRLILEIYKLLTDAWM